MNKITRTSQATSNTSNSNFNDNIPQLSESISSEDEDIVMSKCRRKINVEIINVEVKVSSSEAEEIKIRKFRRKGPIDIINEEMKGSSSEGEDIEICN